MPQLKNLCVMKIDAKQELDNINSQEDIDRFMNLIMVPDGISIDSLLDGDRYFLTGEKGAGKTALLIYTALKAEKLFEAERTFIIFKDFSQEEREDYTGLAHVTNYNQEEIEPFIDYEFVWWWVFHNTIVDAILSSKKEIFIPGEALNTYLAAVKAVKSNPRGESRKMPIITKDGYVEAELSVPIKGTQISLKGRLNFERKDKEGKLVKFSTHIHELNRLFMQLDAGQSQLYVVVDELNLSRKNDEEYERDLLMIRDLIIAIEKFNTFSKNSHDNVRLIGAVRTEVINSVKTKGKEINKSIESYGIPIDWTQYNEESFQHPLIKLLINYFRISDLQFKEEPESSDSIEYYKWVDKKIFGAPSEDTIRNYTLYRPRHVVRLLNLSKLRCGNDEKISTKSFNQIKRQYSTECWNEVTEELALAYSPKELELIKEWLTGMPYRTTYNYMVECAKTYWTDNPDATRLLERIDDLIRALYKAGVIGNFNRIPGSNATQRWYFRGDETLLKKQEILIHRIFETVLITFCQHYIDTADHLLCDVLVRAAGFFRTALAGRSDGPDD